MRNSAITGLFGFRGKGKAPWKEPVKSLTLTDTKASFGTHLNKQQKNTTEGLGRTQKANEQKTEGTK